MEHILFIICTIGTLICNGFGPQICECAGIHSSDSDNDFAEFEDFDENFIAKDKPISQEKIDEHFDQIEDDDDNLKQEDETSKKKAQSSDFQSNDDNEAIVQDENDDFSHFSDEDEFIGYDNERPQANKPSYNNNQEPKITIANVPLHLRSNWDSFYLEILMVTGIIIYFINFILGKAKNQKLALDWMNSHKRLLESNFALVGDDEKAEIENGGLRKESENIYILWCSGRSMMEGMLVEFKLLKRQDLIGVISQMIRPSSDQLIIRINLEEMDTFVFALGTKKSIAKLNKDMTDISTYCPDKRSADKFVLGSQYSIHSELNEVTVAILKDQKVMSVLDRYQDLVEYFHFSDQYSGPKQQEDVKPNKLPEVKKTLVFAFNFTNKGKIPHDTCDNMNPVMHLVLYLSDKISRLKLSKEAKQKAEKNRSRVEEAFLKATHNVRAEMAQTIREEKKRKEREKMMNLDDPDKQKKWEEKEQRRQNKRRNPKMKTLKIKPI